VTTQNRHNLCDTPPPWPMNPLRGSSLEGVHRHVIPTQPARRLLPASLRPPPSHGGAAADRAARAPEGAARPRPGAHPLPRPDARRPGAARHGLGSHRRGPAAERAGLAAGARPFPVRRRAPEPRRALHRAPAARILRAHLGALAARPSRGDAPAPDRARRRPQRRPAVALAHPSRRAARICRTSHATRWSGRSCPRWRSCSPTSPGRS
jgi:hypothetical protein